MHTLFRNRDFTRLFAGRVITNAGDSLYFIAAMWLVYDLTGDPFYSGVAGFLTLAPAGLQAFVGPLVDRWDLRRLLVVTQVIQAGVVLVLPVAHALDYLSVGLILVVMPLLSTLNQFVYPAQSAALPRIVEGDELVSANSAFALAYQGVDSAFNALGGVLIALVGTVTLFLIDSVTFVAAALLFATVWIPAATDVPTDDETGEGASADTGSPGERVPVPDGGSAGGYLAEFREGIEYLHGTFLVLMLGGTLVINFVLGSVTSTMPAYADGLGGPEAYGLLLAAISIGIFLGAASASAFERYPLGWFIVLGFLFSGLVWTAAVAVNWLPATAILLTLAGVPVGASNVLIISLIQTVTPERLLGRVTAVLGSVSTVVIPFGALAGGAAASVVGPAPVLFVAGGGFLFLAAYVFAIPTLRRLPTISSMGTLSAGGESGEATGSGT